MGITGGAWGTASEWYWARMPSIKWRHRSVRPPSVVAKLSSWPDAQNGYLVDTLRACGAVAAHLSG
jgi:hypothetical protein